MNIFRPDTKNYFFAYVSFQLRLLNRNLVLAKSKGIVIAVFLHFSIQEIHLRRADKSCHKLIARIVIQCLRCIHLLDNSAFHNHNTVAHGHSFRLVMGNIDKGRLETFVKRCDLASHLSTELRIQVGQRLVEKEYGRISYHGTSQCHTLSLSSGECLRFSVQILFQSKNLCCFMYLFIDFILRRFS